MWGLFNNYLKESEIDFCKKRGGESMAREADAHHDAEEFRMMRKRAIIRIDSPLFRFFGFSPLKTTSPEGSVIGTYANMVRFDLLRPLYYGMIEYQYELKAAFYDPLVIVPLFWLAMYDKGRNDSNRGNSKFVTNFLLTLIGTVLFAFIAMYSFITALLGLITRPIATGLLATKNCLMPPSNEAASNSFPLGK